MILGEFFILRNNRAKKKRGKGVAKKRGCGVVICRYKKVVFFRSLNPRSLVFGERRKEAKLGKRRRRGRKNSSKKEVLSTFSNSRKKNVL
jgi:hypothetical protein